MAATARMLRARAPLGLNLSSSSSSAFRSNNSSLGYKVEKKTFGNGGTATNKSIVLLVNASSVASESVLSKVKTQIKPTGIDLPSMLAAVAGAALTNVLRPLVIVKRRMSWKRLGEMLIEKGIIDCRFFTLFAVGGTLLGSVLCFVEGFFLILESYIDYFQAMSKGSDDGHVVQLLVESIDMFLAGSSLLVFGIGLYTMFIGTSKIKGQSGLLSGSSFFGLFRLKRVPAWMEMQSVSQAKSQIGRSILMMLQVGVLEKFKSVPIVTPLDLACFAGAVVISSAGVYLLSRLRSGGDGGW
ncbi:hypothetical protein ACHQM5_016957 [Ranunculus cassubicifolius]